MLAPPAVNNKQTYIIYMFVVALENGIYQLSVIPTRHDIFPLYACSLPGQQQSLSISIVAIIARQINQLAHSRWEKVVSTV